MTDCRCRWEKRDQIDVALEAWHETNLVNAFSVMVVIDETKQNIRCIVDIEFRHVTEHIINSPTNGVLAVVERSVFVLVAGRAKNGTELECFVFSRCRAGLWRMCI